jgi:DNA-binding response OmpR family regulator
VVEDDPELNALVGAYAQICGFDYHPALDGTSGLAVASERNPAAVILDLMLPDLDGFEVCSRLKANPGTRDIPVIILTALDSADTRRKAESCGAVEYMTKPFDPDRLMSVLTQHTSAQRPPAEAK